MKSPSHTESRSLSLATDVTKLSEAERVFCWRIAVLAQAGYPDEDTVALASSAHVDLHEATELIESGCPVGVALRILL
jgi:hypothetical protein